MPVSLAPLSSGPTSSIPGDGGGPERPPVFFPPWWLPTWLAKTIPSYLYVEYNDDDALQALVSAYNQLAQRELDWFNGVQLAVYTNPFIQGSLLDWIAQSIYGLARPVLPSGRSQVIGPLNTYAFNVLALNQRKLVGSLNYYITNDDVFKRCLTWNFFKGDGRTFDIRWLKRRIMRFLLGANGSAPNVDQTYQVSIILGPNQQVTIRILAGVRRVVGGAIPNRFAFNTTAPNQLRTTFQPFAPLAYAATLKAAIESGALQLPFQYNWIVIIESAPPDPFLFIVSGVLHVSSAAGWPTSASGLPAGFLWSNSGVATIVVGSVPDPSAPPVYYPGISAHGLLALGGGNLPLSAGPTGSGQLWNNSNIINVS